jgi:TetR/AcrR family transcriptional regulator, copper-responsive repressor
MSVTARRGRHKAFNREEALQKAAHLFWKRGFSPTSLADLTEAMGIHPPSLYNAFGGKEALFLEVLKGYLQNSDRWLQESFAAHASIRQAITEIISLSAKFLTDPAHPPGCLLACGGVNLNSSDARIEMAMRKSRRSREALLVWKLRHARRSGELPASLCPLSFAAYLQSVLQGMSAQARDGASCEQLTEVGRLAMQCWPEAATVAMTHAGVYCISG